MLKPSNRECVLLGVGFVRQKSDPSNYDDSKNIANYTVHLDGDFTSRPVLVVMVDTGNLLFICCCRLFRRRHHSFMW